MPANCPIKYTLLNGQPSEAIKTLLMRRLEFWAYYSYTRYKQMPVDHFRK